MADLPSTKAKTTLEADKTTVSFEVKSGLVTGKDQLIVKTDGTVINKAGIDVQNPIAGGALIADGNGNIVGEIVHSSSGNSSLKATAIYADGRTVEVNKHISDQGKVQTQCEFNPQMQQQAANLFNSVIAAQHWDNLKFLGKASVLVNLYNAADKLGEAFSATGNNLPGDLGAAAGIYAGEAIGMYLGGPTASHIMQQADITVIEFGKASNDPQMRQAA